MRPVTDEKNEIIYRDSSSVFKKAAAAMDEETKVNYAQPLFLKKRREFDRKISTPR
jgi:hypothetical protein